MVLVARAVLGVHYCKPTLALEPVQSAHKRFVTSMRYNTLLKAVMSCSLDTAPPHARSWKSCLVHGTPIVATAWPATSTSAHAWLVPNKVMLRMMLQSFVPC